MSHQNTAERDTKRRDFILNGNMLKVLLYISMPLVIYHFFTYIYGIVDLLVIADKYKGDGVGSYVSSIAMIGNITALFTAIGTGLATGCSIVISRLIGKNDYVKAKTVANTLLIVAFGISVLVVAIVLPLSRPILKLCGLTEELISIGIEYFVVQIFNVALNIFNGVFLGLEKARGATKGVMLINLIVIIVKVALTLMFVYVLSYGTTMVAVASFIANLVVTIYAVGMMLGRNYLFKFSAKNTMFKAELLKPYFSLSVPIFLGRFVFSLGKVIVNANAQHYGTDAPGALSMSNHISGSVSTVCGSFEDGASTVISQNVGAGHLDRVRKAFLNTLAICMAISIVGAGLLWLFNDPIVSLFAGDNAEYAALISKIAAYERIGLVFLGLMSPAMSLIYGLGYTKIGMLVNLSRLFVFRVPTIYILIYCFPQIGAEALGIAMMISNCCIGLMSIGVAIYCLQKIKNTKFKDSVNL